MALKKFFANSAVAFACFFSFGGACAEGYFGSPNKTTFEGWACNPASPNYSGWVHFWRDDNKFLGALQASIQREPAVASICGDSGVHGFNGQISYPSQYLDNQWHTVRAYFINQDGNSSFELQNSVSVLFDGAPPPVTPSYAQGCNVVSPGVGWVTIEARTDYSCSPPGQPLAGSYRTYQYLGANSPFVYPSGYQVTVCPDFNGVPQGWYDAGVADTSSCPQNYYGYVRNARLFRKY